MLELDTPLINSTSPSIQQDTDNGTDTINLIEAFRMANVILHFSLLLTRHFFRIASFNNILYVDFA